MTVGEWCDKWLAGYGTRRASTVRQAEVHIKIIKAHFGSVPMSAIKPSDVRAWTVVLKRAGRADSYIYAIYSRLSQIFTDAVHDGIVARNPCSRRTSPGMGKQRPYVATTRQVWALYDAVPLGVRPAILLGAHAGLRLAEAAAFTGHRRRFCHRRCDAVGAVGERAIEVRHLASLHPDPSRDVAAPRRGDPAGQRHPDRQ
jgi:site-specific recombinase XerC